MASSTKRYEIQGGIHEEIHGRGTRDCYLQSGELIRDLEDALTLHVSHDRHDEALRRVHGHADVVARVVDRLGEVLREGRVQRGVPLKTERGDLQQQRQEAELGSRRGPRGYRRYKGEEELSR